MRRIEKEAVGRLGRGEKSQEEVRRVEKSLSETKGIEKS